MRSLALLLLVSGCAAPDRYHVTGSRGRGDFESEKGLAIDSEEHTIEVGVSGDLPWAAPDKSQTDSGLANDIRALNSKIEALERPAAPGGISDEILLGAVGLLLSGGGVYGYRRYQARRK